MKNVLISVQIPSFMQPFLYGNCTGNFIPTMGTHTNRTTQQSTIGNNKMFKFVQRCTLFLKCNETRIQQDRKYFDRKKKFSIRYIRQNIELLLLPYRYLYKNLTFLVIKSILFSQCLKFNVVGTMSFSINEKFPFSILLVLVQAVFIMI